MENIKQIIIQTWKGKNGDDMQDVLGLGEDNRMYRWHRGTGTWILYVIQN